MEDEVRNELIDILSRKEGRISTEEVEMLVLKHKTTKEVVVNKVNLMSGEIQG